MTNLSEQESRRLEIQGKIDSSKSRVERNRLGQFSTPLELSIDMLRFAQISVPEEKSIRFLDPAFGTGAFYSALLSVFPSHQIETAVGYEIDPEYAQAARTIWRDTGLKVLATDFTKADFPENDNQKFDLLICNPPYVRHHHLLREEKIRLKRLMIQNAGVELNGLSGLYCYFMCLSHMWLKKGGIAGWLVPGEFMDVNYGRELKGYLLDQVSLMRIHRFDSDDLQFGDALVSSAIVFFRNIGPRSNHKITFTHGGSLLKPRSSRDIAIGTLRGMTKWSRFFLMTEGSPASPRKQCTLSDFFEIKRGLATGANRFFILTPEEISRYQIPKEFLKPILPSPRFLGVDEVKADMVGNPNIDQRLFLLNCKIPEDSIKRKYPSLWEYLQSGEARGIDKRYLCKNRYPWYVQENRPPAPLLCSYMGRHAQGRISPFRFILNYSKATATNSYLLLYPKPNLSIQLNGKCNLLKAIWGALNEIPSETLEREGRVYGGGLHKLEPRELAHVPADKILALLPNTLDRFGAAGHRDASHGDGLSDPCRS